MQKRFYQFSLPLVYTLISAGFALDERGHSVSLRPRISASDVRVPSALVQEAALCDGRSIDLLFCSFSTLKVCLRIRLQDALVVAVSLVIELYLEEELQVAGIIVLFRLWRMLRIMHGVYVTMHEGTLPLALRALCFFTLIACSQQ